MQAALCDLIIHSKSHLFPGFLLFTLKLEEYSVSAFRVFHFQERDSLLHYVTTPIGYWCKPDAYWLCIQAKMHPFYNLSIFLFPSAMVVYILFHAFILGHPSLIVFLSMKIFGMVSFEYKYHRLWWQNTSKFLFIDLGIVKLWHLELI